MSLSYLIDENVNPIYPQQLKIIEPSINVIEVKLFSLHLIWFQRLQ